MNIINFAVPDAGNFLVRTILWLVTSTGSVALGIILFTVILKAITLPFDIMSRRSMRKNSLLMESMRPDLERLQKQYANNKDLYNQKMMALYKKNGYSMWGACLPTILTLVIFIVAINGFTAFSQYQNRQYFYNMSNAYNSVIYSGIEKDGKYIKLDEEGKLVINDLEVYGELKDSEKISTANHEIYAYQKHGGNGFIIYTENGFIKYSFDYDKLNQIIKNEKYELIEENLFSSKNFENASSSIFAGFEIDGTYIKIDSENKKLVFDNLALFNQVKENGENYSYVINNSIFVQAIGGKMTVSTANGYMNYQTEYTINADNSVSFSEGKYFLIEDKMFNATAIQKESGNLYFGIETDDTFIKKDVETGKISFNIQEIISSTQKKIEEKNGVKIYSAKTELGYTVYTENGYTQYFREVSKGENPSFNTVSYSILADKIIKNELMACEENNFLLNSEGVPYTKELSETLSAEEFIKDIQGVKSAEAFNKEEKSFLWVKNIWVTDGAHKHPVLDYEEFKVTVADTSGCGCSCSNETTVPVSEQEYNLLTSKLTTEKTVANGFYILCILSALISLASQLINNKSQKAQLELQTVDGQGATNQKMMTWMMPMMMAVFSFMYTSAFSIYIIINTTLSILTTFVINKIVDKKFTKVTETSKVVRGRVYTPKQEQVTKKVKDSKKEEKTPSKSEKMDFLSGLADGKRPSKKVKKKK